MPSNCIVPFCGSKAVGHRFPKDPILRNKWFQALSIDNDFHPTEFTRVCKLHFLESDFVMLKVSNRKTRK